MVQYTIHRALAKIKTTEKRFQGLMKDGVFVSSMLGKTQVTPSGRSVKEVTAEIRANYDSAITLLANYETLKLAVIRSNSGITRDTVGLDETKLGGKKMLAAEIIAKRKYVMPLYEKFLATLSRQFDNINIEIACANERVQANLSGVLASVTGGSRDTLSEMETKAITETYYENNACFILDPLQIQEKIRKLQKETDDFQDEADARLSELNALRMIEVDLSD